MDDIFSIGTNIKKNCLICDRDTDDIFKYYCKNCLYKNYRKCIDCRKFNINNDIKPYWVIKCRCCFNK